MTRSKPLDFQRDPLNDAISSSAADDEDVICVLRPSFRVAAKQWVRCWDEDKRMERSRRMPDSLKYAGGTEVRNSAMVAQTPLSCECVPDKGQQSCGARTGSGQSR